MTGTFGGRSFVVALYALIVAIIATVGAILGTLGPANLDSVTLLGVVEIQPTPVGLAVYGAVTVGLILGILLALVAFVSRWTDAESAGENSE